MQLGQEGQVDWYEAWAELSGEQVQLQVFSMRSMASGAAFHRAYHRATQQAFLDAHEHAFNYFRGVFARPRYDNLKAAVKKILRGYRREETARFIAFRSHWRFSSEFCSPVGGARKGRHRGRGRLLSAQPLGAGAEGARSRGSQRTVAGRLPRRRTASDRRARAGRWAR